MTTVAVLGTGYMGAPMARNIATAGHDVQVWNRTRAKAEPLAGDGVTVADDPAEAVRGADVVVTMLSDGPTVGDVIGQAAGGIGDDVVWLQMSTVGVHWGAELADAADKLGVTYVDAPVLGTRAPAEQGQLVVLAASDADVADRVQPLFDAVGSKTIWLDEAGQASRLKVVINAWITALTAALAESVALAEHLDLDPHRFLEAIDGGAVGAPYAQIKGPMMIDGEYPTSFPARLARKDSNLVLDAAGDGPMLRVAAAVADAFAAADDAGHGGEDMAAVRRAV